MGHRGATLTRDNSHEIGSRGLEHKGRCAVPQVNEHVPLVD